MALTRLLLAVFTLSTLLSAAPAHAVWKVVDTKFQMLEVLDIANGRIEKVGSDENFKGYGDYFASFNHEYEVKGNIIVREYDRETISKRTTTINNVYAVVNLYGLNFRAGSVNNSMWPIRGMQGKRISDIFSSTFKGAKLNVGLAFIVAINPNYSLAVNGNGVRIADVESLVGLGLNIGVEMGYLTIKFRTESVAKNSKNITVSASGATVVTDNTAPKTVSIEDVKKIVVGTKD